jgi:hypothetical protein
MSFNKIYHNTNKKIFSLLEPNKNIFLNYLNKPVNHSILNINYNNINDNNIISFHKNILYKDSKNISIRLNFNDPIYFIYFYISNKEYMNKIKNISLIFDGQPYIYYNDIYDVEKIKNKYKLDIQPIPFIFNNDFKENIHNNIHNNNQNKLYKNYINFTYIFSPILSFELDEFDENILDMEINIVALR